MAKVHRMAALLWAGFGISALLGAGAKLLEFTHPGARFIPYAPFYIVATALAMRFCLKIAGDHRDRSTMRLAWLFMTASCATTIVRHVYEWGTFLLGWHGTARATTLVSLRQIPTVLAMLLLTAGLVVMWSSFAAVGLGVRFRWRDAVLPLVILGLTVAVLPYRQEMWDDRSAYPFIRYLQWSSPVTLALPALIGLALQRTGQEMRGGRFADFLRYLVWSLLLRLASLMTTFATPVRDVHVLAIAGTMAFWASPWLFALAVERRWRITESLGDLAELYARNPQEGLATLSRTSGPVL